MSMILSSIRPVTVMLILLTVIFGFIYPVVSTLLVQNMFPNQADGSLIRGKNSVVFGSKFIGQQFSEPKYFWSRPSAANYNAAASTGSNLGVANPALLDAVKTRIEALKAADPDNIKPIPVDLVTASGSGLDPEISLAAAEYQISRVALARGIAEEEVRALVARFTSPRQFGMLGEPRVNVLQLNLALDGRL